VSDRWDLWDSNAENAVIAANADSDGRTMANRMTVNRLPKRSNASHSRTTTIFNSELLTASR